MNEPTQGPSDRDVKVQDLIAAYLEAAKTGQAPPREEWLAGHPELAEELRRFLDNHEWMQRMGVPPRQDSRHDSPATVAPGDRPAAVPPLDRVHYFGDYELLAEIARGGMGIVYKARQVSLNRIVALKMILAGQLASERDVQRFRAEAEAVANLDHPNIVPIYETGTHDGQHYFSMRFVDGGSLIEVMPALQRDPRRTATLLRGTPAT